MREIIRKIKLAFWRGVVKSIKKDIKETETRTPGEFRGAVLDILNESLNEANRKELGLISSKVHPETLPPQCFY